MDYLATAVAIMTRVGRMSYRPKLGILIIAAALLLLADKTFVFITNRLNARNEAEMQKLKKLAKDETFAEINRLSAQFAQVQGKLTQPFLSRQDRLNDNKRDSKNANNTAVTKSVLKIKNEDSIQKGVSQDTNYVKYLFNADENDLKNQYVNLHQYDFILNNKNACSGDIFIVILIHSDPRKFQERKMIRDTWGSVSSYSGVTIVHLFLLAKVSENNTQLQEQIVSESETNLDIVQGNFIDSYHNLTCKCIMGLHWVQKYCKHTKFVLKVDDDTMIDIYHLIDFLLHTSPDGNMENFLYCSVYRNQGPRRSKDDKWYVSESEYPFQKYPPYCEGFAYIMSSDVAKKLYDASSEVKFYWIDDVYVTGLVALKAGIKHRKMEIQHGYNLLETEHLSENLQSSMFLLAKYDYLRQNWNKAWDDIKTLHKRIKSK